MCNMNNNQFTDYSHQQLVLLCMCEDKVTQSLKIHFKLFSKNYRHLDPFTIWFHTSEMEIRAALAKIDRYIKIAAWRKQREMLWPWSWRTHTQWIKCQWIVFSSRNASQPDLVYNRCEGEICSLHPSIKGPHGIPSLHHFACGCHLWQLSHFVQSWMNC